MSETPSEPPPSIDIVAAIPSKDKVFKPHSYDETSFPPNLCKPFKDDICSLCHTQITGQDFVFCRYSEEFKKPWGPVERRCGSVRHEMCHQSVVNKHPSRGYETMCLGRVESDDPFEGF
ncbi:hypothetical protein BJ508DRAFT_340464 [Ascobolus immersus RN42]|uniref:Uncharacterized protein n=1 Tax=Ascobolus immersus RN42 TaxID=1160509 RepID=A0A3N4HM33_ASCIM|nr:hypothetical protein BJ508DRAFT_340464 [Ascobolus immersus RN42]